MPVKRKLETIRGTVSRVIFKSDTSDYRVLGIKKTDGSYLTVQGSVTAELGNFVEVYGVFAEHSKYGSQFKALSFSFSHDNSIRSISNYIQSIAKWIGPEKSFSLASTFKGDLENIIENFPERLIEAEGVGDKAAKSLVEAWQSNRQFKDIKIFLGDLGLSDKRVNRVLNKFGLDSQTVVESNPWILTTEGFGFSTCDTLAEKLEIPPNNPNRFIYFIKNILEECKNNGHLFLTKRELLDAFIIYNRTSPFKFQADEITYADIDPFIKEALNSGFILNDNDRYYDLKSFFYENESAKILSKILETPSKKPMETQDVEKFLKSYQELENIRLSSEQIDALTSFQTEKIMIVTGAPGTGKTTVLKSFVSLMNDYHLGYELLCPTGIAAKKLQKTVNGEAYTIHRRFGYNGEEWAYNQDSKFYTDVIIVDEFSMVDQELLYRLLSAIVTSTKLVFVGDVHQLPSVGPGNVLKELIKSKLIKTIMLEKIHRQAETSDIIKAANMIKNGDTDLSLFKKDPNADIIFIEEKDLSKIQDHVITLAMKLKEKAQSDSSCSRHFQIITPRNSGPLSVDELNLSLQSSLNPPLNLKKIDLDSDRDIDSAREIIMEGFILRLGDRIMVRKNNYNLGIYNGDIGKVSLITPTEIHVILEDFEGDGETVQIPIQSLDGLIKLAYSVTTHKSQGLEYPYVIIPFVKQHGKNMLQRNLIYTAITRAKKRVIIIGHREAIIQAIENNRIRERNTLLAERLNAWKNGVGISLSKFLLSQQDSLSIPIVKQLLSIEEKNSSVTPMKNLLEVLEEAHQE